MNQLTITNTTITYNHQVIKTSNISSIDLKEPVDQEITNNGCLVAVGIFSAFIILANYLLDAMPGMHDMPFVFGAVLIGCFWLNLKQRRNQEKTIKENHKYFLVIQTNAGKQELFGSKDYDFINGIRLKIQEALDTASPSFSYAYNIDNKTIINNPTGNISITHINQYAGLSDEDKDYLKNNFEPVLQKIQNEINKSNNEDWKRNFEILRQELKSSKPRKSILETAWSVFGNVGAFAEFAGTMEKAFNLF